MALKCPLCSHVHLPGEPCGRDTLGGVLVRLVDLERRVSGAVAPATSARSPSAVKEGDRPWEAAGVSRATFYRRLKQGAA